MRRRVTVAAALLVSLTAASGLEAQPALAPTRTPAPSDRELARVAASMAGTFDTFEQAAADEAAGAAYVHKRTVLHVVPLTIPGLSAPDALAFYVEQAAAASPDEPEKQRVHLLARRGGALVARSYCLVRPAAFAGAHSSPELLARLTVDALRLEEGCDLVWTRIDDELYAGIAGLNGTCRTSRRGAARAVSQVLLTRESVTILEQGFDRAGRLQWGPPPGTIGNVFRRRPPGPFLGR